MRTHTPSRSIARRLVPWAALLIVISSVVLGSFAIRIFDEAVGPELKKRTQLIGSMVRSNIQLALDSGIPLDSLTGVEKYLGEVLDAFGEVESIAILTTGKAVVSEVIRSGAPGGAMQPGGQAGMVLDVRGYELERYVLPVLNGNTLAGHIVVSIDRQYIATQFRNIFLDIGVVIIVATLFAFEIMLSIVSRSFIKPLDRLLYLLRRQAVGDFSARIRESAADGLVGRISERFSDHAADINGRYLRLRENVVAGSPEAGLLAGAKQRFGLQAEGLAALSWRNVVDMRLPLFLFVAAGELSKPFLPLYIKARLGSEVRFGEELLISLPLLTYLLSIAVLSPFARSLINRVGSRRVFLLALAPVIVSHIGLGVGETLWEIALWLGLAGAAFALATIACQDYALGSVDGSEPGRAMGGFVAVVIGGTFCGTAVGGVLADRIGQSNVFLAGAVVVAVAGLVAFRMLGHDTAIRVEPVGGSIWRDIWRPFQSRRIMVLLLGVTIPANVLIAAFLWYLVPLLMGELAISASDTGRVMMTYYLCIILLGPIVAARAVSPGITLTLLVLGGGLSGGALLAVAAGISFWHVAFAVLACGVAHSMLRAPSMALSLRIAEEEFGASARQALPGALLMVERLGSVAGLLAVAYLAGQFGFETAINATGAMALVGVLMFAILEAARLFAGRKNP